MSNRLLALSGLICLVMAATVSSAHAQPKSQREVAVTFDDLPAVSLAGSRSHREITTRLLKIITSNKIPAIGFVNEGKLFASGEPSSAQIELLQMWVDAGLELGNHSFSHPDLHTTPLDRFQQDVIRGEGVTRPMLERAGKRLRYFRHPFLHTGRDLETKRSFESFLAERGYSVAPVTVDNSDWIFARAYDRAIESGDKAMMKRIGQAYVSYMERKFDYFEKQSTRLFGYEIKQVLLLHANALNSDYFDDLARMITRRGYRFIPLERALTDKAYSSADTYTGPAGITWLHRWALSQAAKDKIVPDEPLTPDFVLKLAGVARE